MQNLSKHELNSELNRILSRIKFLHESEQNKATITELIKLEEAKKFILSELKHNQ